MKSDDLSWLSAELGLPVLEEATAGVLANAAAQARSSESTSSIVERAAAIAGVAVDHPELRESVAAARRGERHSVVLSPDGSARDGSCWRIIATPLGEADRIRLAFLPVLPAASLSTAATPAHEPTAAGEGLGRGLVDVAAAVSHEVANAVGSIRGWAELALHATDPSSPASERGTSPVELRDGSPVDARDGSPVDARDGSPVDARDALLLIRAAARSAEQAARSMLSLARGEAQPDQGIPLDLTRFAGELLQLMTLTAREARVNLESTLEPGLFVRATRAQLFTILFNLLKNAVEACPHGGVVSLHASAEREQVQVSVRDTGSGLDRAAQKRLFERYYTTKAQGTGLGLALVHSTVEACGASIEVESAPGRGTCFRVTLPRASEPPVALASVAPPLVALAPVADTAWVGARQQGHEVTGHALDLRVLVVDDDHALREMLATALSLRGADVISVRSSEEALELEGQFDIALIDMMLDDCRGDELLAMLRQRGVVNAAMLVTGTVQKPRLVPGGEPDDWVRKPFEISHLVDRIRRTLERHRMLADASHSARA